jgi:AraC-like DNA-binding protein
MEQLATPEASARRLHAVQTSDPNRWEQFLIQELSAERLIAFSESGMTACSAGRILKDVTIGFSHTECEGTIAYSESNAARLRIADRGKAESTNGKHSAVTRPGDPTVSSPHEAMTLSYGNGLRLVFIRFEEERLEQILSAFIGHPIRRKIEFHASAFARPDLVVGLQAMAESMLSVLDVPSVNLAPLALKELEQALSIQFLQASQHTYSETLHADDNKFIPVQVRRAAEYIDAHWNKAISVEKLAEVSGTSVRTLFAAFSRAYGVTPMVFVKRKRLRQAQRMLQDGRPNASVTGVAFACGFFNTGHFARDYRLYFGEMPSQTLKRGRC